MKRLCGALLCASLVSVALAREPAAATADQSDARFDIRDDVLIRTPDGATLSAIVVRPKDLAGPLPTVLTLDIYTDPASARERAENLAAHGFVSVMADVRGKRLSPDKVVPYEHDASDSYAVIDWIARQPWSNGKVGMLGGSYSGFTAWAATKRMHPALKTIAVSAAAIPGLGLPMYNNIFLNANYGWAFYTTNNKTLDEETYNDNERWHALFRTWFASGRSYRAIDRLDGRPNPWLQRWLQHPAYDSYWQNMVPYKQDFSKINIPVLTITGYYDDGQISALHYLKEHVAHHRGAEHYLVVGPYDHFGTHADKKPAVLRDYEIDAVAQMDSVALKSEWMRYILQGGAKPALLRDRINYQVMGANEWRHAPSLEKMSREVRRLYFTDVMTAERYELGRQKPARPGHVEHVVDLADRKLFHNFHAYPFPIIQQKLEYITEVVYASVPFDHPTVISGAFKGELHITINKKDVDLGVTVYQAMPDGRLFHLGYSLGRASFARDGTRRTLLTPGKSARIPFETTLVARRLEPGSRLLVLLDVNKNPMAQVNYGTGKDVSDESIGDAKEPLRIQWHTDSYVDVPIG
jgi:uncharacterized protein